MQKHLVLAAVSLMSVLAPSVASAQDAAPPLTCRGSMTLEQPKGGMDVGYSFGCNQAITSFSVVTSQELDFFNSRSELVDKTTGDPATEGKAYECQGEIPGDGFSCVAGDQPTGTRATGDFGTSEPACNALDRSKSLRAWLVVMHTEGEGEKAHLVTSHPFALKRGFKCPKPAKQTKKKQRRNR